MKITFDLRKKYWLRKSAKTYVTQSYNSGSI